MPVYEFYCSDCHAVFSFLSRRVDTVTRPPCPDCKRPELTRHLSVFSAPRYGNEGSSAPESQAEISAAVSRELGSADNDDPRDIARVMDSLYAKGGHEPGEAMREALDRMGAGEDPERIEADLGAAIDLDETQADSTPKSGGARNSEVAEQHLPRMAAGLYELKRD